MTQSDKQQKQMGKTVQFGIDAISKPTPLFLKYIFRAVAFLSGVWAILPQDLIGMTDQLYGQTNRWIIVLNTVVLFAIKFFKWDYKED